MAASVESRRHTTLYTTPHQNRVRSSLLDSAKRKNKRIIRMSDYEVVDPNLVPPKTPEDRKSEVLAGIMSGEQSEVLRKVLDTLEELKVGNEEMKRKQEELKVENEEMKRKQEELKVENEEMKRKQEELKVENEEMKRKQEEHQLMLDSARAVALRFFLDYVHSLYTVGAGHSKEFLYNFDSKMTLQLEHTLAGRKCEVLLTKDKWKVLNLQTRSSEISASHAHTSSLKKIAISLLSPDSASLLKDDIETCKELFLELFCITPENVMASDDPIYKENFPLFQKNKRKIGGKTTGAWPSQGRGGTFAHGPLQGRMKRMKLARAFEEI